MNTAMDEVQRQVYLQRCGITLWYSRVSLPGAASSIEFEFPQAPEEAQVVSHVLQPTPTTPTSQRPAEDRAKVTEQKAILSKVVAEAAKPDPASHQRIPDTALRQTDTVSELPAQSVVETFLAVNLRYIVADELILVAQLGDDLPVDLQEKLLLKIASALGRPVSPETLDALAWPAFANRRVPGNDDRGLAAVLERMLGQYSDRACVGLGADISGVLTGLVDRVSARDGSSALRLFFEHDLAELATSGALKRQLWNLLQNSSAYVRRTGR